MALSDGRFYPSDLDKGDVARILMYMVVRYEFLGLTDHVPLLSRAAYTVEAAYMGKLSLLLSWHQADPVDQFEKNRNEIIFGYQNNRNPFIDHPELFEEVYNYFMSIDAERNVTTMIYIKYEVNYSELTRDRKELYA
jgi:endonuclease I